MTQDLRDEIEWLEHKIDTLEEYIKELERENFQLKGVIGKTISTLEEQNSNTRKIIYGQVQGSSVNPEGQSFVPLFQKKKDK